MDLHENTISSPQISLDELLINQESYERLRSALLEIDEISRIVLEMKYIGGYSHAEIAKELQITTKYVETRLYHGKQRLRRILEGGVER